ncbi:MAG: hypothetical protein R2795_25815 [Saprospiraceae bacterium]
MKNILLLVLFITGSYGVLVAQNGCVKGNCLNGQGTYEFPSGSRYVGDFEDGKMHGKGILYFPDGSKYIGNWVQSTRRQRTYGFR